ncbi:MAG TPA: deoxyribonuclease V [Isosphaeraceae bacterium]|nr:deoxyribonuclease V [Isosphaeraceae bacterium]
MQITTLHSWDLETVEARALQESLARRVDTSTPLPAWKTVAAADVSFNKYSEWLYAAVVVVQAETFGVVERVGVVGEARFPYVPGLLSFREAPPVLEAFARLEARPDVVICDGQGIAHPRRIGLASHLGLWLGLPTIGCAKSLLCGEYDEPGPDRGDRSPLIDRGEVVGSVVRTRSRIKPLFISPGHLCDLEGAIAVVLATSVKYRLPVPSRMAHDYVNELRRAADAGEPLPP